MLHQQQCNFQTEKLDQLPNSFNIINGVCCFNHTMQLSAKALLKPFNCISSLQNDDADMYNEHDDNMPALQTIDEKEEVDSDGEDDNDDEEEEDPLEALEMRKGSSCCRTQMQFTHH
jgi:hypothetical protein